MRTTSSTIDFSYLDLVSFVEFSTKYNQGNVENDDYNHCSHNSRVLSELLVQIVEHCVEVNGIRCHRQTSSQTAEQVGLEPDSGWRTSCLELATIAGPELVRFVPLLTRQLRDTVRVRQQRTDVTNTVRQAFCSQHRGVSINAVPYKHYKHYKH